MYEYPYSIPLHQNQETSEVETGKDANPNASANTNGLSLSSTEYLRIKARVGETSIDPFPKGTPEQDPWLNCQPVIHGPWGLSSVVQSTRCNNITWPGTE